MTHDPGRRRRRGRRLPPVGSAPGTLAADPAAAPPALRLMAYGPGGLTERSVATTEEIAPFLAAPAAEGSARTGAVWLDVDGVRHAPTMQAIGELLSLHRLTIADIVNAHQRPKIEDFSDYLFIVLRMPRRNDRIEFEQVSICVGANWVITFQEEGHPGDCFEPVRERLRHSGGKFRSLGPDYLAYALLDAVIDAYFPVLEDLGAQLDAVEDLVLERFDPDTSRRLHLVRRDLITVRRAVWPLREAMNALIRDPNPLIGDETRLYLRDCYDHTVQIIDLAESYRDVGSGLMEVYLSSVSNRMNEIMKWLTMIATIFIPLTFIVGVYGMNFDPDSSPWNMPELRWRFGYPAVMGLMFIIAAAMLFAFWRTGWLGKGPRRKRRPPGGPPII